MRLLPILAGAILATTSPLSAQVLNGPACGSVEEQATVFLDATFGLEVTQSPTSVSAATPAGCTITDLDIYVEELGATYRVERVIYTGEGLLDWVRGDVILPAAFTFQANGIALQDASALPSDLAWVAPLRADTIAANVTWNEATRRLNLSPLRLDLGDGNAVSLRLSGTAPGWAPYDYVAEMALQDVALGVTFNGLFEQAIAPPLRAAGVDVSSDSMAFMAALAYGMMANAPPNLIAPEAQVEVVDFMNALPAPRGVLSLTLTNDAPFYVSRIARDIGAGLHLDDAVPERLRIDADWAPTN